MSVLRLNEVSLKIEDRWLIRGASLRLCPGRLTAFVGPNGAGKTTLLRVLAGLWEPTEGSVTLDGWDLRSFHPRERARHIALVPQNTHMGFAFTVWDVVMMGRHPHRGRFQQESDEDRRRVSAALARTDTLHLTDRLVTELSGGERQRVTIARSLATEADVLLLDEPTANLDVAHALQILELLRELAAGGQTVALAIHDLNAAARCAAEVVLVHEGRIMASGPPHDVLTDTALRSVFSVRMERAVARTGETVFLFRRDSHRVLAGREKARRHEEGECLS